MSAPNGSVSQTYYDGIINVGGDPTQQYALTTAQEKALKTGVTNYTNELAATKSKRISGETIYIYARDININGTIQSGYARYSVDLSNATIINKSTYTVANTSGANTTTVEQRLKDIASNNAGKVMTDAAVVGNDAYLVIKGEDVQTDEGYYNRTMDVYYNPTTGKLIVPDTNANGGKIYLTGNISSTGSGNIYCLDGTYNIEVNNTTGKDLQLGELVVNDVQGKVSIADLNTNTRTEYTRNDNNQIVTTVYDLQNTENDPTITYGASGTEKTTYATKSGLRYNWTTGTNDEDVYTYQKTWYNSWWGAGSDSLVKMIEQNHESNSTNQLGEPIKVDSVPKPQGSYIGALIPLA